MPDHATISEEELEREFRQDRKAGLEYLELYFRRNIFAIIKSACRYAQPNDLADIYQDTMARVVKAVCQDDFDPARPMRLVQVIAVRACADFQKKKQTPPVGDSNEVSELIGGDLWSTKAAMEWKYMLKEDIPKFRRALDQAIDALPNKQKVAAQAMMDVFEEVYDQGSFLPLKNRIEQITGESLTTVQAYDNWRAARAKIADKLRRAGFDLLAEE
jgi:DNA-directed RNA polymerase specialized sigma24 family protein